MRVGRRLRHAGCARTRGRDGVRRDDQRVRPVARGAVTIGHGAGGGVGTGGQGARRGDVTVVVHEQVRRTGRLHVGDGEGRTRGRQRGGEGRRSRDVRRTTHWCDRERGDAQGVGPRADVTRRVRHRSGHRVGADGEAGLQGDDPRGRDDDVRRVRGVLGVGDRTAVAAAHVELVGERRGVGVRHGVRGRWHLGQYPVGHVERVAPRADVARRVRGRAGHDVRTNGESRTGQRHRTRRGDDDVARVDRRLFGVGDGTAIGPGRGQLVHVAHRVGGGGVRRDRRRGERAVGHVERERVRAGVARDVTHRAADGVRADGERALHGDDARG